jgi:hypothetical protein
MTTFAMCRDYYEGETFPHSPVGEDCSYHPCSDKLYECWQPDCIEDDEFNLVIMLDNKPVLARGIHFDFIDLDP